MTLIRVLLDTNILISYLLTQQNESAINQVFDALYARDFVLLLPNKLLEELEAVFANKKYLAQRVKAQDRAAFVASLAAVAEIVPTITEEIPEVTRDPKDDYLLAYALVGRADYLVTGDEDLLTLGEVAGLKVVSPREFVTLLENT